MVSVTVVTWRKEGKVKYAHKDAERNFPIGDVAKGPPMDLGELPTQECPYQAVGTPQSPSAKYFPYSATISSLLFSLPTLNTFLNF